MSGSCEAGSAASPATHQLRPKTSSRVYLINTRQRSSGGCSSNLGATHPVNSMKLSEAKTIGQSGRLGSEMTKLCWMRSKVVAKSRPARDGGKGGTGASSLRMTCTRHNTHTTARQRSAVHLAAQRRTSMIAPIGPSICDLSRESYLTSSGRPAPEVATGLSRLHAA